MLGREVLDKPDNNYAFFLQLGNVTMMSAPSFKWAGYINIEF